MKCDDCGKEIGKIVVDYNYKKICGDCWLRRVKNRDNY